MPSSRHTALTLPCTCARSMTRRRIPCTLSSRVIGSSSHSGFLGRTSTLGKIGQMALLFVHGKCQHYYESGQPRVVVDRNSEGAAAAPSESRPQQLELELQRGRQIRVAQRGGALLR